MISVGVVITVFRQRGFTIVCWVRNAKSTLRQTASPDEFAMTSKYLSPKELLYKGTATSIRPI